MKKNLSAILTVLLAALLCACGNNRMENTSSGQEPTPDTAATPSPTATPLGTYTRGNTTIPQLQLGDDRLRFSKGMMPGPYLN